MSTFSDKFFADKAVGALWDVAVSIKRGNPLPLDKDSVVHGIAELNAIAAGAVSYPGQIIAVIEDAVYEGEGEEKVLVKEESTTLYYLDHNKTPREVGKVPVGDELSIDVVDEKISLHDFGKIFYKYVAEVKDDEGNITSEARYDRTEVSTENPWKAGLEPKVVTVDGKLVLGWFEPNPTTIEGVNDQVTAVQGTVADLAQSVGAPAAEGVEATGLYKEINDVEVEVSGVKEEVSEIQEALNGTDEVDGLIDRVSAVEEALGGKAEASNVYTKGEADALFNGKANSADVYTKGEADTLLSAKANASDVYTKAETEGLIASAGHLKRAIVEVLPDASVADEDTIYMIKKSSVLGKDKYEEYMLIDGALELIGDTSVDLSHYAKSEDVTKEIGEAVDGLAKASDVTAEIAEAVKDFATDTEVADAIAEAIKDFATDDEVASAITEGLKDYAKSADVESDIAEAIAPLAVKKDVEEALEGKADKSDLDIISTLATKKELTDGLAAKIGADALEPYAKTEDVNAKLDNKLDASELQGINNSINAKLDLQTWNETLPSLATDQEVADKIGVAPTRTEGEDGEVSWDGATGIYTNIYTKDEITDLIADITGGESAADVLAALNAYKTSNDPRVKALENTVNGIAANEETGTEAVPGLVERVQALEAKPEYELPVADAENLGGVKSSNAENQIAVASDGKMEVNSLNVNKLTQTEGDYIVLYGGSASVNI